MTVFYLDTEYNGFGGELISLALVSSDTPLYFYAAQDADMPLAPWVEQNVMPVLNTPPLRARFFKQKFQEFVQQFPNPKIICDWNEDAIHFCSLLHGVDYGSSLDFAFELVILKVPNGSYESETPHNALADARALMKWHQNLSSKNARPNPHLASHQ